MSAPNGKKTRKNPVDIGHATFGMELALVKKCGNYSARECLSLREKLLRWADQLEGRAWALGNHCSKIPWQNN